MKGGWASRYRNTNNGKVNAMAAASACLRTGVLACLLLATTSAARAEVRFTAVDWAVLGMFGAPRSGQTVDRLRLHLRRRFDNADLDGGGISKSDAALRVAKQLAGRRTKLITRWLLKDLNGDGRVTRAELERYYSQDSRRPLRAGSTYLQPTKEQIATRLHDLIAWHLKADADKDQVVSFREALSLAQRQAERDMARNGPRQAPVPMLLDLDGNGTITRDEFMQTAERALKRVDLDGDGTISAVEATAYTAHAQRLMWILKEEKRARHRRSLTRRKVEACGFPKAPAGAKIVLLGVHEGQAVSTVGLGGNDVPITVAKLRIEPGKTPIYLVLTSMGSMIWQVSGAVDRLVTVVATAYSRDRMAVPRVGITGVRRTRVFVPARSDCVPHFTKSQSSRGIRAAAMVKTLIGRRPNVIAGSYWISTAALPGGKIASRPKHDKVARVGTGPAAFFRRRMLRYHPGGLTRIDPRALVSRAPAKAYRLLPREAGLAQLMERGAIRLLSSPEEIERSGIVVILILKKITIPVGLEGVHFVRFALAPGVPEPDDPFGHAIIIRVKPSQIPR